jgi:hypothetical protein
MKHITKFLLQCKEGDARVRDFCPNTNYTVIQVGKQRTVKYGVDPVKNMNREYLEMLSAPKAEF